MRLNFTLGSKPFYDVTYVELEASQVQGFCLFPKPLPLLISTLEGQLPQGKMTYTSVVMNPVSSDRKRKRMKRQQQTETVGNTESALGVQDAPDRRPALPALPSPRRKAP